MIFFCDLLWFFKNLVKIKNKRKIEKPLPPHPQTAQGGYVNGFVSPRRLDKRFCGPKLFFHRQSLAVFQSLVSALWSRKVKMQGWGSGALLTTWWSFSGNLCWGRRWTAVGRPLFVIFMLLRDLFVRRNVLCSFS